MRPHLIIILPQNTTRKKIYILIIKVINTKFNYPRVALESCNRVTINKVNIHSSLPTKCFMTNF